MKSTSAITLMGQQLYDVASLRCPKDVILQEVEMNVCTLRHRLWIVASDGDRIRRPNISCPNYPNYKPSSTFTA